MRSRCRAACACRGSALALWLAAGAAGAQWEIDWERVGELAAQVGIDTNELDFAALEITDLDAWRGYWAGIEESLRGASLEQIARWRPYAESALQYLERHPGGESYSSWLRERLDYLAVAEESLKADPEAHYEAPPAPRDGTRWTPPPPPAKRTPTSDIVVSKASTRCRSEETWRRRMEKRPAPARAADLVPRLKKVLAAEGLPEQLVWLAEVESSMNPSARSPVGAVGLFQLMPGTARHLGLRTSPLDERKQPEKNARAAARYLRYLHGRFGNWPLALAAYNAGEGRVGGLLKRTGAKSFDAIADELPVETRLYVPKTRAVLKLREQADLDRLPGPRPASATREGALLSR